MQDQAAIITSKTICYIEEHLEQELKLDKIAEDLHYSKFHLHRLFTKTVGLTIHDYIQRRKLTEAAKLLVYSQKPVLEIAFFSGYESQQAFSEAFKAMYKVPPARFRAGIEFYPLQRELYPVQQRINPHFSKQDIKTAAVADIPAWMELVRFSVDGYPCLKEEEYLENLYAYIDGKKAVILRDGSQAAGAMCYHPELGKIDFLAVHPQYRKLGLEALFLARLADEMPETKEISLTTYRAGDKADTGYRETYFRLGFAEDELLVEYGYPTQRLVLSPEKQGDRKNAAERN